jgi:hypothetical protein
MAQPWFRPKWDHPGQQEFQLTAEQLDVVEELSVFHCSTEEIGYALGICRQTFVTMARRDPELRRRIACGQAKGKRALRQVQFKVALSGNCNMLIYLGKVILGQCPDAEVHIGSGGGSDPELSEQAKQHLIEISQHLNAVALAANAREVETEVMSERGPGNGQNIINMS